VLPEFAVHEDSVTLPQNSRDVLGGVPPRGAAQVDGFLVGPHVGGAVVVPGCGGDRGAAASGVQFRSTVRLPTMVRARSFDHDVSVLWRDGGVENQPP
jgi:hypothetical protein